ncbi:rRNA maturation RNase YbeY [Psychromicrobium xiongbiense]|uniref:rRNA maturation RNase YbeY n=1 Tax=Psychromicrobium xiongbiense TaxID=3051184 RepID=UPI002552CB58|nr:rRNA maturation RNase YbeY [Psychromicrobium sp. YIM S02556]
MSIEVNNESGMEVDAEELTRLGRYLIEALYLHPQTDLSILLVDPAAMETLHIEWLGEDGPTDVISIPMDELRPGTPGAQASAGALGDLAICPQVAADQASAGGHSTLDEILLLATHGTLHLLGYDHDDEESRAEMFGLQRALLSGFLGRPAPAETIA